MRKQTGDDKKLNPVHCYKNEFCYLSHTNFTHLLTLKIYPFSNLLDFRHDIFPSCLNPPHTERHTLPLLQLLGRNASPVDLMAVGMIDQVAKRPESR